MRPDEPEDVIVSACQKLTAFFQQRPEEKFVFITQHGLLPLVDLLEVPKSRVCSIRFLILYNSSCDIIIALKVMFSLFSKQVTCAVLQVLNQIIKDNNEFLENACLIGLVSRM